MSSAPARPASRLGTARGPGGSAAGFTTRLAEVLAEQDDSVLAAYLAGGLSYRRLRRELAAQVRRGRVYPVFFGSALTGAGVGALMSGVAGLLPAAGRDLGGPASGRVFKVERGAAGEKIAYVRMFSGRVRARDRVRFGDGRERKVTAISVFDGGPDVRHDSASAGQIGKLWGLAEIRVGDAVGTLPLSHRRHRFAPPTLETVVVPRDPGQLGALRAALAQLAEQDPLINVRQDDTRQEISVSLYGEVQKEGIGATPASAFGLEVGFRETTTICIERLAGCGAAVERMREAPNSFLATVGLRLGAGAAGSAGGVLRWSRPRPAREWSSGSRRSPAPCRPRSSGPSRTRCGRRCSRACTAGRCPTAWSR